VLSALVLEKVIRVVKLREQPLEGLMRDIKKFTSVKILEAINASSKESRKEFLLWYFGKAGRANPNYTHFQVGNSIVIQSS
jgi:hypothetical protein